MTINIEPYNPYWKTAFDALKLFLTAALKDVVIDIQHTGSTAIPGLCAKPILDVDIIVQNPAQLGNILTQLEQLGYINKGEQGIAGRHALRQATEATPASVPPCKWQAHHLYVCLPDSLALKNHIVFRNALLQDKTLVNKYAQLKLQLTIEKNITREKYTTQKTDFIITALLNNGLTEKEITEIKNANQ